MIHNQRRQLLISDINLNKFDFSKRLIIFRVKNITNYFCFWQNTPVTDFFLYSFSSLSRKVSAFSCNIINLIFIISAEYRHSILLISLINIAPREIIWAKYTMADPALKIITAYAPTPSPPGRGLSDQIPSRDGCRGGLAFFRERSLPIKIPQEPFFN